MNYPQNILIKTFWSFMGKPFENVEDFNQAVAQYQLDIYPEEDIALRWNPTELVLPNIQTITLWYEGLDEEAEALDEKSIELKTENPAGFSALDLLYTIHNAVVTEMNEIDHHFFEGITLKSVENNHAVLEMWCGS